MESANGLRPTPTPAQGNNAAGNNVGAEMKCVGFQSLAVIFIGDDLQLARAPPIDHHGKKHHAQSIERRLNVHAMMSIETAHSFPHDPRHRSKEARRFQ